MRACSSCAGESVLGAVELCARCAERREESFTRIRHYLYANTGATAEQIAQATGVREIEVFELLHEGRLSGTARTGASFCTCGKPGLEIFDGRCSDCQNRLASRFANLPESVREELKQWRRR